MPFKFVKGHLQHPWIQVEFFPERAVHYMLCCSSEAAQEGRRVRLGALH